MARRQETILLRVAKGCLVPADGFTAERLRSRGYHIGDVLLASLHKPRNPSFNRLVHAFGKLVADNIEDFAGLDAHSVIKRAQLESGAACDEMLIRTESGLNFVHRIPQSLSFADMDDGQFKEVYRQLVEYISSRYWPDLSPEQIEKMAELAPEAA